MSSTGTISVRFQSSWSDRNGTHIVDWKKDSLDLVAVYCPETDVCYYFDHTQFGKTITLRVETSKNNQARGINRADDYLRVP
ncbi:group I intron-associated PD-(D/E)XK endonuclease [Tunicatimonas pelagia]|uniref:group I intron-associated PD-(D/E)XK endonuclease n=1 Tax=Tunicatimonas pelagia TaxID=931531 RepID=UPI00345D6A50